MIVQISPQLEPAAETRKLSWGDVFARFTIKLSPIAAANNGCDIITSVVATYKNPLPIDIQFYSYGDIKSRHISSFIGSYILLRELYRPVMNDFAYEDHRMRLPVSSNSGEKSVSGFLVIPQNAGVPYATYADIEGLSIKFGIERA